MCILINIEYPAGGLKETEVLQIVDPGTSYTEIQQGYKYHYC